MQPITSFPKLSTLGALFALNIQWENNTEATLPDVIASPEVRVIWSMDGADLGSPSSMQSVQSEKVFVYVAHVPASPRCMLQTALYMAVHDDL